MDKVSVTRPAPPSTRSVLAEAHLCDQVAGLLLIEPKVTRQVFLGEPVEEVLAMMKWSLKHEGDADFDPERILPAWAKKRGRGYWRVEDRRVEECGCCHGTGWVPGPFKSRASGARSRRARSAPAASAPVLPSKR